MTAQRTVSVEILSTAAHLYKQEAQLSWRDPRNALYQLNNADDLARGALSATVTFCSATRIVLYTHRSTIARRAWGRVLYTTNHVDCHIVQVKIILIHPAQLAQF